MRPVHLVIAFTISFFTARTQTIDVTKYPSYAGKDLGLTYSRQSSSFRIWAPTATAAELIIYADGQRDDISARYAMIQAVNGTWRINIRGDLNGKFYAFRVKLSDRWSGEVPDPYAKAVGINGKRAAIIDLAATNPAGWKNDRHPKLLRPTDAIIYELHVRDASISPASGITQKGKFTGLTETNTRNREGHFTGLDHLRELGVTHVHLLPVFDFRSIDESQTKNEGYNWGYDPLNYNVPEGSYASDPSDPATRIREFKQLIQAFHAKGLSVVMDVVYNHTGLTEHSSFNELVPGYYYRQDPNGNFSNATACGNETASERPMFRKFMIESLSYWVKEYHVDGFRFDLMGVHDINTMNLVSKELHAINPRILLYGEGWTAGASPLPDSMRALKANAARLNGIAVFSDDIRDAIKGSVFEHADQGFVSGKEGLEESIKFGIVAACPHPQVDYSKVNYSKGPYASSPQNVITYAECHDNHVLWDKLAISCKNASPAERKEMQKLALSIVLTSQGISFIHAGTEFLRTKLGVENSYNAGDSVNAIDWELKTRNQDVFQYVQSLVAMRKQHPAFRMSTAADIGKHIRFQPTESGLICYTINGKAVGDGWKKIFVALNGRRTASEISLPPGKWKMAIAGNVALSTGQTATDTLRLAPASCAVLYQ